MFSIISPWLDLLFLHLQSGQSDDIPGKVSKIFLVIRCKSIDWFPYDSNIDL